MAAGKAQEDLEEGLQLLFGKFRSLKEKLRI